MKKRITGKTASIAATLATSAALAALLAACSGGDNASPTLAGGAPEAASTAAGGSASAVRQGANTPTANAARTMENLGRGVVALRSGTGSVFISWRLLGLDPAGIAFNVYRSANGGAAVKLNASALTAGTNYSDTTANLTVSNTYTVRPVIGGVEQAASGPFTLTANHATEPAVRIPLSALPGTDYKTKYVWVGDLDGDGEYDFVLDRIAPFVAGSNDDLGTGNQYLEAYKRDGTRLWQINLGPGSLNTYNISPGPTTLSMGMYDGATVYDLNGDGKAEVILKVANGVVFGNGATFTDADANKQYIAVLDGQTGAPLATHAFPTNFYAQAGKLGTQLGIGYPDGISPSIYFWGRNRNADKSFNDVFASWSWTGGSSITENWVYPVPSGAGTQASHQMRILDLDGDGKDEMMTGNFVINANGTLRYTLPGVVHGDRFYVGKFHPTATGMQGYGVQQNNASGLLEYYYDATNGSVTWGHYDTSGALNDVGRGLAADIDPNHAGFEVYSFSGLYNGPSNTLIGSTSPWPHQLVWWDGDLQSDLLNSNTLDKWNPATSNTSRLVTLYHYASAFTGDNPAFIGDILGDWRTEVVAMNTNQTELIIFSTTAATTSRFYTMAHNPAYRNHLTIKGYMQSPTLDYYFGQGMSTPVEPNIRYAGSGQIQAETAVLAGATSVATNNNGYKGKGFLDFPGTGGSAQFNYINGGAGGSKTITIRFANATAARTGVLKVNGVSQAITFPATGSWSSWSTMTVTVNLAAGMGNTLRFESTGNDLANIDEIIVP